MSVQPGRFEIDIQTWVGLGFHQAPSWGGARSRRVDGFVRQALCPAPTESGPIKDQRGSGNYVELSIGKHHTPGSGEAHRFDEGAVVLAPLEQAKLDGSGWPAPPAVDPELGPEGYHLSITPTSLHLSASTEVGFFYGAQTLAQLRQEPSEPGGFDWLPCVEIIDRPRFRWRGQLLDVSRHFHPIDVVRRNIDRLAALKMNVFHWHLTDDQGWRIESAAYPKLTSVGAWRVDRNDEPWWGRAEAQPGEEATYGGFYTKQEIHDLVEYAADRGVTIVPEVDVPGHSRAILAAYPELSCDGVQRAVATGGIMDTNTLCPGKDATFEFLERMLAEVTQLFPSEYFHIGGDECNKRAWSACDDCAARMQAEGLADVHELQSYFIRRCEEILARNGKRLIGWDEILEGGLAPNAAVMSWRGESGGITSARAGHEVVMSPNSAAYLDLKQGDPETEPPLGYSQLFLRTAYDYDPIPAELTAAEAKLVLGFQGNLWGESIQHEDHLTYMLLPRLFAIAEGGWSQPEGKDWADFVRRVEVMLERDHEQLLDQGAGAKSLARRATTPAQSDDPLEPYYARNAQGTAWSPAMYQVAFEVDDSAPGVGLLVSLSTEHGAVDIRWTDDGSEPSESSVLFTTPLHIDSTTTLHAAAFRGAERLGRISTRRIDLHQAIGAAVDLLVPPSSRYPGGGAPGLVDGRRGTASHLDARWLGFEATDLVASVDLGEVRQVSAVTLSCLEAQKSWIFLPAELHLELSTDGDHFVPAAHLVLNAGSRTDGGERRHALRLEPAPSGSSLARDEQPPVEARFLRVTASGIGTVPAWHAGAGGKPWIFVDELIVE
ncbi:MAG: family 20 glycosylhydrolase [Planctomycetota bacterium]|nr:family 20 glycosylhydrolase [Planctomycetota bacterium]